MLIRSTLKAEPINIDRIKKNKKIKIIEGIQVKEIKGTKAVEEVVLNKKIKNSNILKLNGVFIDIGHVPKSELAKKIGVKTNKKGEIIIDKQSKTNKKGVYAAGDITDTAFKQAITGVGEAVKAVYEIYESVGKDVECM
jgi:thioredoxin reductase